jgi:hypothetical protein
VPQCDEPVGLVKQGIGTDDEPGAPLADDGQNSGFELALAAGILE